MPVRCSRSAASAAALLVLVALALPATFARAQGTPGETIAICTVTDVKGKTLPCGCHVPKGGLARQASFLDSLRTQYDHLFFADNGGYFPEEDERREAAPFLMDAMMLLHVDAVGVGERDLRFGLAYLRENAKRSRLPVTCANLVERAGGKSVFPPYVLVQRGKVKVGFFGVLAAEANLGPSRDSLEIQDPEGAAARVAQELRKKGAHVVVALSNLGKIGSEDLCTEVEGVDVVIAGRNVPVIQKGRLIQNAIAVFGGEQGQHMARTLVTLDRSRKVTARDADVYVLGPEIADKREVSELVDRFEDHLKSSASPAKPDASSQSVVPAASPSDGQQR
jgi:2',3'-cyclic-nucleotide 2'-phosphodiesterase (5'-nucleotidase family)